MFSSKKEGVDVYMNYTDLLTAVLIVFVVITIKLVIEVQSENQVLKNKTEFIQGVFNTRIKNIQGVQVEPDGTIRFVSSDRTNSSTLFAFGSDQLSEEFKKKLNDVLPVFIGELFKVYRDRTSKLISLREIRIEGFTNSTGSTDLNLNLSQRRAMQTWFFIRDSYLKQNFEQSKDSIKRSFYEFVINNAVTVGYGESRLIFTEKGDEDKVKSRRVELGYVLKSMKINED